MMPCRTAAQYMYTQGIEQLLLGLFASMLQMVHLPPWDFLKHCCSISCCWIPFFPQHLRESGALQSQVHLLECRFRVTYLFVHLIKGVWKCCNDLEYLPETSIRVCKCSVQFFLISRWLQMWFLFASAAVLSKHCRNMSERRNSDS